MTLLFRKALRNLEVGDLRGGGVMFPMEWEWESLTPNDFYGMSGPGGILGRAHYAPQGSENIGAVVGGLAWSEETQDPEKISTYQILGRRFMGNLDGDERIRRDMLTLHLVASHVREVVGRPRRPWHLGQMRRQHYPSSPDNPRGLLPHIDSVDFTVTVSLQDGLFYRSPGGWDFVPPGHVVVHLGSEWRDVGLPLIHGTMVPEGGRTSLTWFEGNPFALPLATRRSRAMMVEANLGADWESSLLERWAAR